MRGREEEKDVLGRRSERPRRIDLREFRPQHRKRGDLCREDYSVEHERGDERAR